LLSIETECLHADENISNKTEKKKTLIIYYFDRDSMHNNAAELAAKARVRKRDFSL
jgi:hypothetical protein